MAANRRSFENLRFLPIIFPFFFIWFFTGGTVGCLPSRLLPHIVSGAEPLCLRIILHTTSFQPAHEKTQPYAAMRFHGMAELFCSIITFYLKSASTLDGIFICPAPYWQGVCRADWLNLSIVRGRERFPLPARPPACCSGCPHRAEVSLWLPLGLPATESPAPDAACCLPSPVTVLRFTLYGQAGHGEADCPVQLYQGKTLYSRCILVFSCQVSYIQAESLGY